MPPNGWKFKEGETLIKANTFDALVKAVIAHRLANNIFIGETIEEVEDQLADENPSIILNGQVKKKVYGS